MGGQMEDGGKERWRDRKIGQRTEEQRDGGTEEQGSESTRIKNRGTEEWRNRVMDGQRTEGQKTEGARDKGMLTAGGSSFSQRQ